MKTQQDHNNELANKQYALIESIRHLIPVEACSELENMFLQRYSLANLLDILNGGQTEYYSAETAQRDLTSALATGWSVTGFADTFYNGEGVGIIEVW